MSSSSGSSFSLSFTGLRETDFTGGTSQIDDLTVCTALCQITDLTYSAAGFTVPALSRHCEATSLPAGPGSAAILDPGLEQAGRETNNHSSLVFSTVVNAAHSFYNGTTTLPISEEDRTPRKRISKTLNMTTNPEEKRKIIGDTFVKIANEVIGEMNLNPDEVFLAQGTLRPDLIESASLIASVKAEVIKTHHNDTELIRKLREEGKVIEPLKDFHKDEVRILGRELELPEELVSRHPFPGPGLAIRVICAEEPYVCKDFAETNNILKIVADYSASVKKPHTLLQRVKACTTEEDQEKLMHITSLHSLNAFLLPIKTVGVQGDCRSYSYVCGISSKDAPHWESLMYLSRLIPRMCHNINRVVYVFGPPVKEPPTDVTPTFLTTGVLSTLRQADFEAHNILRESGYASKISQMPVILTPLHFDRDPLQKQPSCQRSVVIRTFITSDFMTGIAATPGNEIPEEKLALGPVLNQSVCSERLRIVSSGHEVGDLDIEVGCHSVHIRGPPAMADLVLSDLCVERELSLRGKPLRFCAGCETDQPEEFRKDLNRVWLCFLEDPFSQLLVTTDASPLLLIIVLGIRTVQLVLQQVHCLLCQPPIGSSIHPRSVSPNDWLGEKDFTGFYIRNSSCESSDQVQHMKLLHVQFFGYKFVPPDCARSADGSLSSLWSHPTECFSGISLLLLTRD
ncbi:unnamed protein product [Ranitomeya imitator]|uniref:GMP synthase (glutamine-hydrolyzing) n=1 Tax=Ranitomeya imitator TaxID=111125 RepID=A0ABN9LHW4_9NEOB|nr:unnamed protein product [Ranitomeya imitator]